MLNFNMAFETELRKLIEEEIERLTENLANGLSTPDFAAYKGQVGKIAGLTMALDLFAEAKTIISKKY